MRAGAVTTIVGAVGLCVALAPAAGIAPPPGAPGEASIRARIARAAPLLAALESHKVREGRYPQSLDHLIPRDLAAIPLASGANEARSAFVYHGREESFELFFHVPPGSDLFLYRSSRDDPERREPGPYELVKTIENWAWYRVIPMRNVVIVREWKGRLPIGKEPLRVRSSVVLFMGPVIDDRGDLKPNVVATPDAPSFWSYAICLVERDGIVSVAEQPL
ncbi:MAG TPA: hypothetical protein VNA04_04090 [Thermoanaerobaculia bacterium]|nr:hypothetical protein [Thermoanaerobaculia bacterium]